MSSHIELNRKFWPVEDKGDVDPDTFRYLWSRDSQPGWPQLLQMPRVVVLAEAGTGKTEEFRETARRLHDEGKATFFCALEDLVQTSLDEAFDIGTFAEFKAWLATDQPGWLFLDSVDEARLVSYDHFMRALKRISRAIGSAAERAHIYISGRGSDWNSISDLRLVEDLLPAPKNDGQETKDEQTTKVSQEDDGSTSSPPKIKIFRLAPLSQEQIKHFARHNGVVDPSRFIEAIERADASIFAERPRDLIDLIAYWQQFKKIASLAEMTEYNVEKKLTETNPKHKNNLLTPTKARAGAETIAAALTFSHYNFIALPDPQSPLVPSPQTLDAKALLADWQSSEVESLLRRALFDEATYGRARVHHRSVREYLTAQWLYKLLQHGKSRRSIEQLFFAERYGLEVVIPSMKPIAAWMALWDENICRKLCDIAPEILIGYGDPSWLPIPTRERLLRKFAEVCASNRYYDESLDLSAVRRLADSRLSGTIIELLNTYRLNEEVRQLLLRVIWQGAINECAEIALSFALDMSMDSYTRLGGIRAIGVCGSNDQQQRVATAILADSESSDVSLTSAVCVAFFPQLITVDALLETLTRVPKPKRFSINPASDALQQIIEKCPQDKLLPLLAGLVRLLEIKPYVGHFCEVSERYAWLLPHAKNIAQCILTRPLPCVDEAVLRTVEMMAQSRRYHMETSHGPKTDLQAIIDGDRDLRHQFFWRAVEKSRESHEKKNQRLDDWRFIWSKPAPWKIVPEDFSYFLGEAKSLPARDNQLVAYSVALSLWNDAGRDKYRLKQIKTLARHNTEMATKLDYYLNPPQLPPEELEYQREMAELEIENEKKKRRQKRNRQIWINKLQNDFSQVRSISKDNIESRFPNLHWLAADIREHKNQGDSKWGVDQWEVLIDEFGLEVAEAARDGLMAYWRLYQPTLKSEKEDNGVPNGLITGLVGLAIEAKVKPEWARHLSPQEALLAARYALHEMNGFPDWIGDLLTAHPSALDEILQGELRWEFGLADGERNTPVHYMLAQVRYSNLETLRNRYSSYILQLLQTHEPWRDQTLENALSIILQWGRLDVRSFSELAKKRHFSAVDESRFLTWLVAWLCVDADGAMLALQQWLSGAKRKNKKERMVRFCGAMGGSHSRRFGSRYSDFERLEVLRYLVPLAYKMVAIEDDLIHEEAYTPDFRDNAEWMRNYLLNRVCDMPGRAAFETLVEFSSTLPYKRLQQRMHVVALRRAAADAELAPWQPVDMFKFAREGEKKPSTAWELFDLVCNRLDDVKYNLEDGDTSIAVTLQRIDQETELRNWFADALRNAARGKYSIAPEEELADAKRPDIRVHVQEIDAPGVIELKISDNWSYQELVERLQNQLVGQYLRDARSRFGVFLLTRRQKPRWRAERLLTFKELVKRIQEKADRIVRNSHDLDAIKVIGIDLSKRTNKLPIPGQKGDGSNIQ